MTYPNSCTTS